MSTTQPARLAHVAVDTPLAHLDRWFDYSVPPSMTEAAVPGVRVRVRFGGRLTDGFIIAVEEESTIPDGVMPLERVVSPEVVLTPDQVALARAVADHWCGTFADVVRLAVAPRHATTEKATRSPWPSPQPQSEPLTGPLDATGSGSAFIAAIARGEGPRAFWQVPPVHAPVGDWAHGVAQAAEACLRSGRRALMVVPDAPALEHLTQALVETFGAGTVATLHADLGPSARYRQYLAVSRGTARLVVGTRSAVMAPMPDCGLVAVWDEGSDLHAEPRAPYPHARDIAALRASQQGAALLLAGHGRSCEAQQWLQSGWLHELALDRSALRRATPATRVAGADDWALARDPLARSVRLPAEAFQTIRTGLAQGPVLVQVARSGWAAALACDTCGTRAECEWCHGPLRQGRAGELSCGWCGRPDASFRCRVCGGTRLRAPLVGASRTVEELGRAFPGVRVIESSADKHPGVIDDRPALVVATQGAEPVAAHGYAAVVVLDTVASLSRADLRAAEESLRRWLNATALARPAEQGGSVIAVGPSAERALQALVRLDPATFAARELADRHEAMYPPAATLVQLEGSGDAIAALTTAARLLPEPDALPGADVNREIEGLEVLGPVPHGRPRPDREPQQRLTLRVPLDRHRELVSRLKQGVAIGSARKTGPVRVRVNPAHLA